MKRFRMRAVGLGLALAAGAGFATADEWRGPGPAAVPPVAQGAPELLPAALREAAPPKAESGPVWMPAREPAPVAVAPAGGVTPSGGYLPSAPAAPTSPRPTSDRPPGALPEIPVIPEAPAGRPAFSAAQPEAPPPRPSKQADPPMMLPPRAPGGTPQPGTGKGDPLPLPRPLDSQPLPQPLPVEEGGLPTAPAHLMYSAATVGGKHAVFGSPPIRLSRDYPPLSDLIQRGHMHDGVALGPDGDGGADGGPMNRFFVSGEYLLWWMPGFATPVLGTTNANTALNGYLGEPGTTALAGPGPFLDSTRSGFRVRAGAWLDDCGSCGIDGSFFFLGRRSASAAFGSDQFPILTRPAFVPNLIPGTDTPLGENGEAVAVPGALRGALGVRGDSRLWGADVNLRKALCGSCDTRAEVFVGYRHLNLRESLIITENISVIGTGGGRINITDPVGTQVFVQDQFATRNYFNGGQIGGLYERQFGRWYASARGSVALGSTHQVLEISGSQVRQRPGMPAMSFTGGLLAAGPNLGTFTRDRFSVAPEFTLNFGYRVTDNLRVFAGYNFLLWTNVIRPGDQIDHVVDLTFVPNALPSGFSGQYRPRPLFKQTDLVVNGIQFGLDWRW